MEKQNKVMKGRTVLVLHKFMKSFIIRFSATIFEESEDHTYEMEYEEPKNDGMHFKVLSNPCS